MKTNAVQTLNAALARKSAKLTVRLSNCGNPDYRQDPDRPLPETVCGFARVDTLAEASDLCRMYIEFYELGGGNWDGGQIENADGVLLGKVAYNGKVFPSQTWTPGQQPLYIPDGCEIVTGNTTHTHYNTCAA